MTGTDEPKNAEPAAVTKAGGSAVKDKARKRRQRSRSVANAAILGGLVIMFYIITVLKMSGNGGAAAI